MKLPEDDTYFDPDQLEEETLFDPKEESKRNYKRELISLSIRWEL